ncbi:MAG: fumarylacetoacetate hydrolase family protein [archaeon]|nr:fumarylacetoacetate hydrolase family protein [archaeon]
MAAASSVIESCRKVVCIGRNYMEHVKELGNKLPGKPFFFLKPPSSLLSEASGLPILLPAGSKSVHHEVEMALLIGSRLDGATALATPDDALIERYISGYAVALDLTDRDAQNEAKSKGLPWTAAKGYDTFCPISDFVAPSRIADCSNTELWLQINGVDRQRGSTSMMIFPIPALLRSISAVMTLHPNDIVLTGTPSGVSAIQPGDLLHAGLSDIVSARFRVEQSK